MTKRLQNKICIVTGGTKGIGKAIVDLFIAEGAVVYNLSKNNTLLVENIDLDEIENVYNVKCELTDESQVIDIIGFIRKKEKKIDCLVNNAGIEFDGRIGMLNYNHIDLMLNVNLKVPILLIEKVFKLMMRKQSGSIINLTSVVGELGNEGQLGYSASKGGLIAVTKTAAKELAKYNIRVNAVSPGLTNTEMLSSNKNDYITKRIENIKMGRLAETDDIAKAVLFLASDESSYISGQVIRVDGLSII